MDEVEHLLSTNNVVLAERSGRSLTDDELSLSGSDREDLPTRNLKQGTLRSLSPSPLSRPSRGPPDLERVEHAGRQTGPKGVRDDAKAAAVAARQRTRDAVKATRAEQERRAITVPSYRDELGEEARKALEGLEVESDEDEDEDEELAELRRRRVAALRRNTVREVGEAGYLSAVERRGWVLVAIYEPDMPRCEGLLDSLAWATVPAVRARASRIAFSLLPDEGGRVDYDDYDSDSDDERAPQPGARPDPDVLPTLLAYRDGNLVHNWVRVDLEAAYAADGLKGLLKSEGIA